MQPAAEPQHPQQARVCQPQRMNQESMKQEL